MIIIAMPDQNKNNDLRNRTNKWFNAIICKNNDYKLFLGII